MTLQPISRDPQSSSARKGATPTTAVTRVTKVGMRGKIRIACDWLEKSGGGIVLKRAGRKEGVKAKRTAEETIFHGNDL